MKDVLWISLIGAGLVFLGLVVLWLLMDVLVSVTSRKKKDEKEIAREGTAGIENEIDLQYKQKAAAASVAVSLALLNTSFLSSRQINNKGLSSWQIIHRSQQIYNKVELPFRNRISK
ncbi:MAG: OadG family protein [Anaerolineaceae bacterium]|nr:OadG family protein [Anaerolineaceae bacterium]